MFRSTFDWLFNVRPRKAAVVPRRPELSDPVRPRYPRKRISTALLERPATTASDFLPENEPYNTELSSLQLMISKVHGKSSIPLAYIIAHQAGSSLGRGWQAGGAYSLLSQINPWQGKHIPAKANEWWALPEEQKLATPNYAAFVVIVEQASKVLGVRLRDAGMQDVRIEYYGSEASELGWEDDLREIQETGGQQYHLNPTPWTSEGRMIPTRERVTRISVIAKTATLQKLYTRERLRARRIKIVTNTPTAEPEPFGPMPPDPLPFEGRLWPQELPLFGVNGIISENGLDEEDRKLLHERIRALVTKKSSSESLKRLRKGPIYIREQQQPTIILEDWEGNRRTLYSGAAEYDDPQAQQAPSIFRPFSGYHVPDNDGWWQKDITEYKAQA